MKRYPFGKFILDVPDNHRIAEIHKLDALYDRMYGLIIEEIAAAKPDGAFFDIGANIGDTAAYLATFAANPIYALEGNANFLGFFKSNLKVLAPQVRLIEKFVRPEALRRHALRYEEITGTGEIRVADDRSERLDDAQFIDTDGLSDALGIDKDMVALIKTDTDGLDGFIIGDLIPRFDTPLFFECDTNKIERTLPTPWPGVFRQLGERGYSVAIFDNHGLPMMIAETDVERVLTDLSGYTALQRAVRPVRIHYLDVWAFPKSWRDTAQRVFTRLRSDFLKPFRF